MNQTLFESWLELQCRIIPGTRVALARLEWPGHQSLIASVPANADISDDLERMLRLARSGKRTVAASATSSSGDGGSGMRLAYPLADLGEGSGAIALEMEGNDLSKQKIVTRLLKWAMPGCHC